ncbi:MAG: hypothetical protein MR270_01810 [Erysipelotrichaceae bacterium]|nr:hypothetical protein [Erysipelotrichaceae bacterium]
MNNQAIRFSSIKDFFDKKNEILLYKMVVPYTDTYLVSFKKLKKVEILDENNQVIISSNDSFKIDLVKNQIVIVKLYKDSSIHADIKVTSLSFKAVAPYEPINVVNTKKFKTHGDNLKDPLQEVEISATKRDDKKGIYINCNNPEKLTSDDIGKALSRVDITNKKVFFTFEHNNLDTPFYYGYQVKNTGKEDLYITMLNFGLHLEGAGCWLGEKEWIDFYNVNFRYDENMSDKQKKSFVDYFNFTNKYKAPRYQPITYRIPSGKYIYVMCGTTIDAYKHINVYKSANKLICGGCSNAAILFDVIGQAEGAFYVYDNVNQIKNNTTHQGYVVKRNDHEFGAQYVGYDNCHGVVDTYFTATFNDATKSQDIPVTYVNYYANSLPEKHEPYMELKESKHRQHNRFWVTHANNQGCSEAIGSDMTKYYTINEKGEEIVIDKEHLDGRGELANVGNWMMDYMDYFTFVNQGDKDREIIINMKNTGSLCVLVKNINGKVIKSTPMFTIMHSSADGEEYSIKKDFNYKVTIKAHSIKQFIVEYNLLANSCGYVKHTVTLK